MGQPFIIKERYVVDENGVCIAVLIDSADEAIPFAQAIEEIESQRR